LRYNLTINTKKSAVFAIKEHTKLDKLDLRGIPIVQNYCYLGATIDHSGNIDEHL
jgi:hypothetical protein